MLPGAAWLRDNPTQPGALLLYTLRPCALRRCALPYRAAGRHEHGQDEDRSVHADRDLGERDEAERLREAHLFEPDQLRRLRRVPLPNSI